MHKKSCIAWLILIGLCVYVGLGKAVSNNSAGLFLSPVSQDLNVGLGNLTIYLSVSSIVTLLFLPFGGKLLPKYSARLLLFFAIVLQRYVRFIWFNEFNLGMVPLSYITGLSIIILLFVVNIITIILAF